MATAASTRRTINEGSDSEEYGPSFDSDEEKILSGLLAKAATATPQDDAHGGDRAGQKQRWSQRLAYRSRAGVVEVEQEEPRQVPVAVEYEQLKSVQPTSDIEDDDAELDALCRSMELDGILQGGGDSNDTALKAEIQPREQEQGVVGRGERPGELSPPPPELPSAPAGDPTPGVNAREATASRGDTPSLDAPASTSRSPIERFRPRGRPLSVTDLVSPAWCEMQWAFTLARHGRKRMNTAMASGTRVHQRLESEVHRTVQVEITSKEDSFGLRIWNVIQGLQTLRDTGMTRELEVWGVFKGQLINGCIDELTYICPDTDQEAEAEAEGKIRVAADQTQLTDFYGVESQTSTSTRDTESYRPTPTSSQETPSSQGSAGGGRSLRRLRSFRMKTSRIYICDVKTRAAASIPRGAAFRPTYLQLMLYRHLLGQMVRGTVSIMALCRALRLDPDANFSDRFIAQIGAMNENFYDASEAADEVVSEAASAPSAPSATSGAPSGAPSDSRQATPWPSAPAPRDDDAIDLLLAHNSLRSLWALLRSEYLLTFPMGEASLGGLLKAEYRNPDDGAIRGMKTFVYERDLIVEYVVQVLQWWHGEREPAGVVEQEAYKCRNCDFNDDCAWRVEQEGRATERFREKLKEGEGRRRSRV